VTHTVVLQSGGGASTVSASVEVDRLNMNGEIWFRIRSTGIVEIPGSASVGADVRDIWLRKLSLHRDRRTGASLARPRATRTLEALAKPRSNRPFIHTFISRQLFDLRTYATSDSYDSSDPTKSNFTPFGSYGVYDIAKRQSNGDVATVDVLNDWNLNSSFIYGDVLMPTTTKRANGVNNVNGQVLKGVTDGFVFPLEAAPSWTWVTQNHNSVVNATKVLAGGPRSAPTRHKFSDLLLTADGRNVRLQNPLGTTESWIELWIPGDVVIDGRPGTGIRIDPGVNATIYFGSKVEIKGDNGGYALQNGSKLPSKLFIHAYGGDSGSIRDFLLTNTDFWGVVSAPWYKVKFDTMNKNIHGSFITWQFDVSDNTRMHYDEGLRNLDYGVLPGYEFASWIEAAR
jgi:hypothetical protein